MLTRSWLILSLLSGTTRSMRRWQHHRAEARSRKELDDLLDECGRNCWELVQVERIIEMVKPGKKIAGISVPDPLETWVLFFKRSIPTET